MPLNFVAKAAITVGLTAANMALTMSRKIEGPRLDNLKFTSGDFGSPLPMIWGVRRMEVPIFWAEDLREVKRRRKTKGGKFNEYTYYGTWAVALAGHEIEGVRRIWFDTHLVYDMSGSGPATPFSFGSIADINEAISIYLGTDSQEPDPRMQATVEAEFGEGSCPAYRDTAYVVFKDIPLEKLGNRIPQVSVEILGSAGTNYPYVQVAGTPLMGSFAFNSDFSLLAFATSDHFGIVDTVSRTLIGYREWTWTFSGAQIGFYDDGGLAIDSTSPGVFDVYKESIDGGASLILTLDGGAGFGSMQVLRDGEGTEHLYTSGSLGGYEFFLDGAGSDTGLIKAINPQPFAFADADGDLWVVGVSTDSDFDVVFMRIRGGARTITVTMPNDDGGPLAYHYADDTTDHFVLKWGSDLYRIDRTDGSILGSVTPTSANGLHYNAFQAVAPGAATFWCRFQEINSADLTTVRTESLTSWASISGINETLYDPVNHGLWANAAANLYLFLLDRVDGGVVTLGEIAADVADMVGVETYDFTDLDQEVTGWSTTRGQASNMLEPLLDAYDSDIRPHDFGIEGIKRTGVATGSAIATAWLVGEPRYSVTVKQELPRALLIDFADVDADQQPNTVRADRPLDATDARGEMKLDLTTLALDVDEAAQLANRHFRRRWNERKEVTTALTTKELKLEPGDVRSITLDGDTDLYRCTSLTVKADDTLATEWRYDHPSLATLDGSAGAAFDGRDESTVVVAVLSRGFVLDIPLLTDSDDASVPQVYPLAGPYLDGAWPGATTYQAVDGEYSEELATATSSDALEWGTVTEAMPYANPNLWDRGTELTVTMKNGTLTGCTEAAANANPELNQAVIGNNGRWEIVQFTVATLTAPNTYTVSGFKRGRRGTEWAAELHEAGDAFILVDGADPVAMGLSEVGTDVSFKAITAGRTTGFPFGYTYQGQSLMPYAPVHLEAVKDAATGDWTFTWVRRTRIGGAWTGGSVIPLGEVSEEYELTLGDGVGEVVKAPTTASYVWDVATQTADLGGEVMEADLVWSVAQVSDAVGAGFVATF